MEPLRLSDAGVRGKRLVIIARMTLFCVLWLMALATAGAVGLEFLLRARSHWYKEDERLAGPRFQRLERAYAPFSVEHLHPQYFFFFPFDPRQRVAISNETCSIDADGFRGPGPEHTGGRRLAFLLGGSTAFGFFASSDRTTITGYLNRLQDEYFFVNAGVPGWTSTQEMFRLAFQLVEYHPALIMTLDGGNDAISFDSYSRPPFNYPPGIPDSFDGFAALDEELQWPPRKQAVVSLMELLLPMVEQRIEGRLHWPRSGNAPEAASSPLPEDVWRTGTARYWSNLARMHDLAAAQGVRFIATFQPAAQFHRHLGQGGSFQHFDAIASFHRAVMAQNPHQFEFHDLANVFDQYYATIPVVNTDITDESVFVDQLHLYDPGNEIIARHVATLIR